MQKRTQVLRFRYLLIVEATPFKLSEHPAEHPTPPKRGENGGSLAAKTDAPPHEKCGG